MNKLVMPTFENYLKLKKILLVDEERDSFKLN